MDLQADLGKDHLVALGHQEETMVDSEEIVTSADLLEVLVVHLVWTLDMVVHQVVMEVIQEVEMVALAMVVHLEWVHLLEWADPQA